MDTNQSAKSKGACGRPTVGSVVFIDSAGRSRRFASLSEAGKYLIAKSVLNDTLI